MPNSAGQNDHRKTVGEWLSHPYTWRIPVYQRHYAWDPDDKSGPTRLFWEILAEQALKRLQGREIAPHYFGAILVENKTGNLPSIYQYDVVDGQQRLTTINVAMFAIIGIASQLQYRSEVQSNLAKYIYNDFSSAPPSQQKLVPTNFDKTQFGNLLSRAFDVSQPYRDDSNQARKSKVVHACHFFTEEFNQFINKNSPTDEMAGINALIDSIIHGFELVLIELRETDEAQKVFESLNNTATLLTTFDLIRNDIFYRADKERPELDVELFQSSTWQQFEEPFWGEETPWKRSDKDKHIEAYVPRMLMAKTNKLVALNRNDTFKAYKDFAKDEAKSGLGVRDEITTISEHVEIYKYLVGKITQNPVAADFSFGCFAFNVWENMDWYPVIFTIATCDAPIAEKQNMIHLLESHIIRRSVCSLTNSAYNKQAPVVCAALGNKPSYAKLKDFLKGADESSSTRKFPSNEDILTACTNERFYRNTLQRYIFDRIVEHTTTGLNERRDTSGLNIDHIMPQAWRGKAGWQQVAKQFNEGEIDHKIHTIGNLTPMSKERNSKKSNRAWIDSMGFNPVGSELSQDEQKKYARYWLQECDLKLTRELAKKDEWDLDAIDARSRKLSGLICEIWPENIVGDVG